MSHASRPIRSHKPHNRGLQIYKARTILAELIAAVVVGGGDANGEDIPLRQVKHVVADR